MWCVFSFFYIFFRCCWKHPSYDNRVITIIYKYMCDFDFLMWYIYLTLSFSRFVCQLDHFRLWSIVVVVSFFWRLYFILYLSHTHKYIARLVTERKNVANVTYYLKLAVNYSKSQYRNWFFCLFVCWNFSNQAKMQIQHKQ